ncbi:MAG: PIN domain nuclease [Thermoprotei archaeon]|nr:MAG: PIN domain nuclease [Thermoprotei archaeon]
MLQPYRGLVERLLEDAGSSRLTLYVSPITLSETLYIASRIHAAASLPNPDREALDYIYWLRSKTELLDINEEIMLRAGELKKSLCIALPDCYVIATAERVEARPLFKKLEREMKPVREELRKLGVLFLEDLSEVLLLR